MKNDERPAPKLVTIRTPRLVLRGATSSKSDIDGMHIAFSDPVVMRYWSNPAYTSREQTAKWISSMMANKQNGGTDFLICERKQDSNPSSDSPEVLVNRGPSQSQNEATVVLNGGARLADEGEVIGKIGVWSGNEIGFLLRRSRWGGGLAKEALVAVLDYLFSLPQFSSSPPSTGAITSLNAIAGEHSKEDSSPSEETAESIDWIMTDVDPRNQASLGILKKFGFQEYDCKERTALIGGEWVDSVYLKITREVWMRRTRS